MLIVNPNVTADHTVRLDLLVPGSVIRTGSGAMTLGGKGVNVARVARRYGHQATVCSFVPQADAEFLALLAAREGADLVGVPVPGNARGATILIESSGRVTVLNEPGPQVSTVDWEALVAFVAGRTGSARSLVCAGSLPPGSPADAYASLVTVARAAGLWSVVDTSGEALRQVLSARPDVVSPNLQEAEALVLGTAGEVVEPSGPDIVGRAAAAAEGLVAAGARAAIVSAGSHGAALCGAGVLLWCESPAVSVVNPIGAGDALVGGLVHALEAGRDLADAAAFAIAVASASCEDPLAGGIDPVRVDELVAHLRPVPATPTHFLGAPPS